MSTTTTTGSVESTGHGSWIGGVAAGLAGSLVMGGLIVGMSPPVLEVAMPALYTLAPPANPFVGWFVHLSHGAVFGVIFAAILQAPQLATAADDYLRSAVVGAGYGVVVWIVAAALLMPVWLSAVGFPNAPPFPNFAVPSLLWHVVFGVVLGAIYPAVSDL